ncbi:hypothetical protein [Clostridium beijerinckii]|uniref:hypothetical protein n=1 Tax=Clostridium beijerinckii TaxID=1520 RepID=UPI00156FFC62|nr:hypothetical protein [Clostridium beijerinckii]NRU40258.1 hypothetical protein [Clostridium beijerinckii]
MLTTTNYRLKKPEGTDVVDIQNFNDNADIIDQALKKHDSSLSDMVYQTAGGSATVITLTIKGTLVTGYPITFIASANNGGVATKINGKSVYKPGTTTPPNFIKDKAYTVWYNSISDCFFIKASAEGTAVATNVLAGTTFSNDIDTGIPGGMANNGAVSSTLTNNNQEYVIPAGFHNGLGKIKAIITNLAAAVIKAGTTVGGIVGTFTSDATAVAADIINGKTAYVNSNKITGNATIKSLGGYGVGDIIDAESLSYSFTSIRSTTDYKNIPKMVHDSSGNYYILDGTYVRKFNSSGTLQWSYNCGNTVMDIAINILGTYIYIADGNANSNINGNIRKISSSGVQAWAYPVTSYYMDSLDIDSTENVYASSNSSSNYGYIYKINSSGTLQWSVSVYGAGARALVLDSSANIYLAVFSSSYSSATIYKYNSNGTMLAPTSGVGISYFSKICIDSANNIYVLVETGSLAVLYKYDTNLNIIKSLNFSNDNVQEITVNKAKNTLRLAHYDTGRISRLDSDFNILSTIQTGIKSTPIYSVNMVADNVVALSNSIQTIFYKEQFTITS